MELTGGLNDGENTMATRKCLKQLQQGRLGVRRVLGGVKVSVGYVLLEVSVIWPSGAKS